MFTQLSQSPAESREYGHLRESIVALCLPLAERIARRFSGRGEDHDDLVQVARLGLTNALNRFDPEKGSSFIAFAIPTMTGEIRRHFRDHGWAVHVPRRVRDQRAQIATATAELTQQLRRSPTPTEVADALYMDRDEVVENLIAAEAYSARSLDTPLPGAEGKTRLLIDHIGDGDRGFDRIVNREALKPLLAKLSERDRAVLYLRFFALKTQSQIGRELGISQMHVSRILDKTLRALRERMQE
jgi:RNA polymerase sigma-B factor